MAKLSSLLAFCGDLKARLPTSNDSAAIAALFDPLKSSLRTARALAQKPQPAARTHAGELDKGATALWNLCTNLRRELRRQGDDEGLSGGAEEEKKALLVRSRVFAFLLLDISRRAYEREGSASSADTLHLLKVSLKAARGCIESGEMELALGVLQKGADYIKAVQGLECPEEHMLEFRALETEYFILRTVQSWKEDRLDVAEHMFRRAGEMLRTLEARPAENLCDVLFEIGRSFLQKEEFQMAAKWLDRAYGVIDSQDLEHLSRDGVELRLAVLQALVQALVGTGMPENLKKAEDKVAYIEAEVGDKPIVLLLRLELLQSVPDEEFDILAYSNLLSRMVRGFNFTESHLKFMLHHARALYERSPVAACGVMDDLLLVKIVGSEKEQWVEKAIVLRVWMGTSQSATLENAIELHDLLSKVQDGLPSPIAPAAAAAAQSLLWKQIESTSKDEQLELADQWCRAASHEVFHPAGPQNLAKIARNEYDKAKALYLEMPESAQKELMTRYLMFKVALRSGDHDLAAECLESLSSPSLGGYEFLYSCVLDAQNLGNRYFAAEAMKSLVAKHDYKQPDIVHLPALLRCTIRLLMWGLEPANKDQHFKEDVAVDDICRMFEAASAAIQKDLRDGQGHKLFTVQELDWFSQNSYNLGLQHCENWDVEHILRIFNACLSVIKQYPKDIPLGDARDLSLKAMCCRFVMAAALVSTARAEDALEEQLQGYLIMRRHVAGFDSELQEREGEFDPVVLSDLRAKLATLLIFDFEGAVALKKWDDLRGIVSRVAPCEDTNALKAMADCLLRASKVPPQVLFSTMRAIINELWGSEGMGVDRVAKYIRCLFQMVLPLDGDMGFQLADEALQLVRQSMMTDEPFPDEELEWLTTMSWNHTIDLYAVGKDEECKKWGLKAINLAHYCGDEGRLEKFLQDKFASLRWEEEQENPGDH